MRDVKGRVMNSIYADVSNDELIDNQNVATKSKCRQANGNENGIL